MADKKELAQAVNIAKQAWREAVAEKGRVADDGKAAIRDARIQAATIIAQAHAEAASRSREAHTVAADAKQALNDANAAAAGAGIDISGRAVATAGGDGLSAKDARAERERRALDAGSRMSKFRQLLAKRAEHIEAREHPYRHESEATMPTLSDADAAWLAGYEGTEQAAEDLRLDPESAAIFGLA